MNKINLDKFHKYCEENPYHNKSLIDKINKKIMKQEKKNKLRAKKLIKARKKADKMIKEVNL